MESPFTEDYMNDIIGGLQNALNDCLDGISSLGGAFTKTQISLLDTIEYPCWYPKDMKRGKSELSREKKTIQIQLLLTRDEDEFLD